MVDPARRCGGGGRGGVRPPVRPLCLAGSTRLFRAALGSICAHAESRRRPDVQERGSAPPGLAGDGVHLLRGAAACKRVLAAHSALRRGRTHGSTPEASSRGAATPRLCPTNAASSGGAGCWSQGSGAQSSGGSMRAGRGVRSRRLVDSYEAAGGSRGWTWLAQASHCRPTSDRCSQATLAGARCGSTARRASARPERASALALPPARSRARRGLDAVPERRPVFPPCTPGAPVSLPRLRCTRMDLEVHPRACMVLVAAVPPQAGAVSARRKVAEVCNTLMRRFESAGFPFLRYKHSPRSRRPSVPCWGCRTAPVWCASIASRERRSSFRRSCSTVRRTRSRRWGGQGRNEPEAPGRQSRPPIIRQRVRTAWLVCFPLPGRSSAGEGTIAGFPLSRPHWAVTKSRSEHPGPSVLERCRRGGGTELPPPRMGCLLPLGRIGPRFLEG